ncbi:MAG: GNAT family N-acetyltransferase [Methanosphaera sp.]|nr:GNAT family N-acetyltransferase [Methanosphaera sp.]
MTSMRKMKLVRPTLEYAYDIEEFKDEFISAGEDVINGGELLDSMDSIGKWIEYVSNNASSDRVSPDWVLTDTYLAVVDERIVGVICLRHCLNDFLSDFGHIAFSVRPGDRRKGYAGMMLSLILDKARKLGMKKVKLSAEKDNVASIRTIVSNGGVYVYSFNFDGSEVLSYLIKL